jgi:hypothetical protein
MCFIITILNTFYYKWLIFGWAFTLKNFTKGAFSYDFIIVPGTLRFLIEDGILFGKTVGLTKNLNHIIRRRWIADSNFDLIMKPEFFLTIILRLDWLDDYKIVLLQFFLDWAFKNASNGGLSEDLIDWKRLNGCFFEKLNVAGVKVPRGDLYCFVNRLRLNKAHFIEKL